MTLRLLDAYCCQGAASEGYRLAGFSVQGVDIAPQPRYPFHFEQGDAVAFIREYGHHFDAVHASPPCQAHSNAQRIQNREHPSLIADTRKALEATGRPWVIENVMGAAGELRSPVMLCGEMFGLRTYRHRLFESNVPLIVAPDPPHPRPQTKMGRALKDGYNYHAVGNFSGVEQVRQDLGVPWMNRDGIRECIPPAYTEFIGRQLMEHLQSRREAA